MKSELSREYWPLKRKTKIHKRIFLIESELNLRYFQMLAILAPASPSSPQYCPQMCPQVKSTSPGICSCQPL